MDLQQVLLCSTNLLYINRNLLMTKKKEIIKDISLYASGVYLTHGIDFIISILMKRFLGPVFSGVWASLQVILMYAKFANLGSFEAVTREIPYSLGKKEPEKAEEIKNTVFWFIFMNSCLLGGGIALVALGMRPGISEPVFWGLITISVLLVLQRIYYYQMVVLRAYKKFTMASQALVFSSAFGALPLLWMTWHYQIYGFYIATTFIFLVNILYVFIRSGQKFPFYFSWERLKPLITFGFPIMIIGAMDVVFRCLDRIIIPRYLGFEYMGYYSLSLMAMGYLTSFPNMLRVVLFPHYQDRFSERDNVKDLKNFVYQSTLALAYILPILLAAVWFFSESLVFLILPQFKPGLFPLKILLPGLFFLSLNQQFATLLITAKKHLSLIPAMIALIILGATLSIAVIKAGYGLPGVAMMMTATYFLYYAVHFLLGVRLVMDSKEAFRLFMRVFGVFVFFVASMLAIEHFFPKGEGTPLLKNASQFGLFCVLFLPFLVHLNKETGLWSHLIDILKDQFSRKKHPPSE